MKNIWVLTFIVFISLVLSITTAEGYDKGDVLKLVETKSDLTYAWTEYEICNPLEYKYIYGMATDWLGDTDAIKDIRIEKKETYFVDHKVPVTELREVCDGKNASCWYEPEVIGYDIDSIQKTRWVTWNGEIDAKAVISLEPVCENVRVYATLKPVLGSREIDHIPTAFGFEYPEYAWWNVSFPYRVPLEINTSTPQTNFQIRINVTHAANMQSDFDDLRFVTNCSEDATIINSWLEDKDDGSHADVWINISTDVVTNTTLCMYYGDTDIGPEWDGNSTFIFFDDFEGYAAGSNLEGQGGWTGAVGTGGQFVVTDYDPYQGTKALKCVTSTAGNNYMDNKNFPEVDIGVIGMKALHNGSTFSADGLYMMNGTDSLFTGITFDPTGGVILANAGFTKIVDFGDNVYYSWNSSWQNDTAFVSHWNDTSFGDDNYQDRLGILGAIRMNMGATVSANSNTLIDDIYVANVSLSPYFSFGDQEYNEVTIAGINIYDEFTGESFNASSPDSITLTAYCTNETDIIDMTGSSSTDVAINCSIVFIKMSMDFAGTEHYRTIVDNSSYNNTYDFYMVDLNDQGIYDIDFTLYDLTGEYAGSKLSLRKAVGNETVNIVQNYFDAEFKVYTQLLQNEYYYVEIDNGVVVRNLDTIFAAASGTKILRPVIIQAIPPLETIHGGTITYAMWGDKDNKFIRALYNDTTGNTNNITFTVFNDTMDIVYYSESASSNVLFTYSSVNTNQSYLGNLTIDHATYGRIEQTQLILFEVDVEHGAPEGIPQVYLMMGGLAVCTFFGLIFGPRHADFGAIVISLVAAFFWFRGWFNGYIAGGIIVFCFIIAVLNYISKKGRGGG